MVVVFSPRRAEPALFACVRRCAGCLALQAEWVAAWRRRRSFWFLFERGDASARGSRPSGLASRDSAILNMLMVIKEEESDCSSILPGTIPLRPLASANLPYA